MPKKLFSLKYKLPINLVHLASGGISLASFFYDFFPIEVTASMMLLNSSLFYKQYSDY
jgi:hypothetical protein